MNAPATLSRPDPAPASLRLLNDFQRDFPLAGRPFAEIGARLGLPEDAVLAAYRDALASGVVSRIGAVLAPLRVGASTLAAIAVPPWRLDEVAAQVSAQAGVNHNYERENHWNLWFVLGAPDPAARSARLAAIARDTGLAVLAMPLVEEYHIDLGFDLLGSHRAPPPPLPASRAPRRTLSAAEQGLLKALEDGLALTPQPYAELAARAGLDQAATLAMLDAWRQEGLVKRFGVVLRHRQLGYTANAMCVWDIPDEEVGAFGRALAEVPGVTLCYRRERALPGWSFNLYCMIHGKARSEVRAVVAAAAERLGLDHFDSRVLFSRRCFKQCGSRTAGSPADA